MITQPTGFTACDVTIAGYPPADDVHGAGKMEMDVNKLPTFT
jgi:hypothetical protein